MSYHAIKAKAFLKNEARASWHDRALYAVREKRDRQACSLPEWEELRSAASAIKEHTLSHLATYLEEFERNALANGIKVHWAESGEEMNAIVAKIIEERGAKHLVKSKSMLAEECNLAQLRNILNRPIRVCGMVRNIGEPGGGPFLAYNPDGTVSLQILESSQIDMANAEAKAMFENGTHFNPVDLVCAVKNYKGEKFDLPKFVDPDTGFISHKSKNGRELKAMELPGLWNGAMSDWNTIFVEVPLITFNPVKTVNDLLRDVHM